MGLTLEASTRIINNVSDGKLAVATQAIVDVSYGPQGLALLRLGYSPASIIKAILDADPDPGYRTQRWPKAGRQFAVMNAKGEFAAHTGPEATAWAG